MIESTRPLIFKSASLFNNPSVTVPRAQITIGINVTFMYLSFFNSLARSRYPFHFLSILLCVQPRQQSPQFCKFYYHYYYYYLLLENFSHQFYLKVFHWSLSDCKCPQLSRNLPTILEVLNNVVVWMVSTRLPTSKSSSSFIRPSSPPVPLTVL